MEEEQGGKGGAGAVTGREGAGGQASALHNTARPRLCAGCALCCALWLWATFSLDVTLQAEQRAIPTTERLRGLAWA